MSEVEATPRPDLTMEIDGYKLTWANGISMLIERVTEHRDELTAEFTVRSTRPPRPGLLHRARLNMMSSQTRKTLAKSLSERDADLDWSAMLEQACYLVTDKHRSGEPAIDLRTYAPPPTAHWLLEPFIERGGPTILFADGGTGKSMVALGMAVAVASGQPVFPIGMGRLYGEPVPVLYLDWETDAVTVNKRMRAIAGGANISDVPPVYYRRQAASLKESVGEIRREIARVGAGMVVIDSFGMARGGEPESADVTIQSFAAIRALGVPALIIDHVTKAAGNESTRPFGSAYTHNLARITWGLDRSELDGSDSMTLAMVNRKWNDGRNLPRIGLRVDFEVGDDGWLWGVTFHPGDVLTAPGLAEKAPMNARVLRVMAEAVDDEPMRPVAISEALGGTGDDGIAKAVRNRLAYLKTQGFVEQLEDGRYRLVKPKN